MWKYNLLVVVFVALCCSTANAQGKLGLLKGRQNKNDSDQRRKDVEGVIWEYKLMEHDERDRSERTKMTGRLRIKQTALFAVGEVEYINTEEGGKDEGGAGKDDTSPAGTGGGLMERLQSKKPEAQSEGSDELKRQAKELLSQRLKQKTEEKTGSERIGDLIKQSRREYRFRFDEDDEYPLSGLAVLHPKASGGGVWLGYYDAFADGKKKKRLRIEMRKLEE